MPIAGQQSQFAVLNFPRSADNQQAVQEDDIQSFLNLLTSVPLPFHEWRGHELLHKAGRSFAVLWGADGVFTHGSWQLLLFPQSQLLVPHCFSFPKSYSNVRRVLIQEQETQRKLLDSEPHSAASTAAKFQLQRAVPAVTHACAASASFTPCFRSLQNIFYNIHQLKREILGGLLNF